MNDKCNPKFPRHKKKSWIQGISQVKGLRTSKVQNAEVFSNQNKKGLNMWFRDVEWLQLVIFVICQDANSCKEKERSKWTTITELKKSLFQNAF